MRFIIKNYVDKITVQDILNFGIENDIFLSEDEGTFLNFYLKNNWEELVYGDPHPIIQKIENKFGKTKGEKISNLFFIYKEKYKDYL